MSLCHGGCKMSVSFLVLHFSFNAWTMGHFRFRLWSMIHLVLLPGLDSASILACLCSVKMSLFTSFLSHSQCVKVVCYLLPATFGFAIHFNKGSNPGYQCRGFSPPLLVPSPVPLYSLSFLLANTDTGRKWSFARCALSNSALLSGAVNHIRTQDRCISSAPWTGGKCHFTWDIMREKHYIKLNVHLIYLTTEGAQIRNHNSIAALPPNLALPDPWYI